MERLVRQVQEAYSSLPNRGKPREGVEWTVLAALLASFRPEKESEHAKIIVVTLATGNKCVGKRGMCDDGKAMHDCHAEVLVRRTFKKVLLEEIAWRVGVEGTSEPPFLLLEPCSYSSDTSTEAKDMKTWKLRTDCHLHLFVSEMPCGDATRVRMKDGFLRVTGGHAVSEAHRTGEASGSQDSSVGVLRTKSGRRELEEASRTNSMSCSDKGALWNCIGLEGAFISRFLTPLRLSSVTLGVDAHEVSVASILSSSESPACGEISRYACLSLTIMALPSASHNYQGKLEFLHGWQKQQ